jgi:hypothetical protein
VQVRGIIGRLGDLGAINNKSLLRISARLRTREITRLPYAAISARLRTREITRLPYAAISARLRTREITRLPYAAISARLRTREITRLPYAAISARLRTREITRLPYAAISARLRTRKLRRRRRLTASRTPHSDLPRRRARRRPLGRDGQIGSAWRSWVTPGSPQASTRRHGPLADRLDSAAEESQPSGTNRYCGQLWWSTADFTVGLGTFSQVELGGLEPPTPCLQNPCKVSSTVSGLENLASTVHRDPAKSRLVGVNLGCQSTPQSRSLTASLGRD